MFPVNRRTKKVSICGPNQVVRCPKHVISLLRGWMMTSQPELHLQFKFFKAATKQKTNIFFDLKQKNN